MKENKKSLYFKLALVSISILLMGSFWLTMRTSRDPVSMVITPEVPKEGEPILATFKLNNPSSQPLPTNYQFYSNGELLMEGTTTIAPASYDLQQYAYRNPLPIGEQINFVIKTESKLGNHEKIVSSPAYPPQIWMSITSIAAVSTTMMSSIITTTYYKINFADTGRINVGILVTIALLVLFTFLELARPSIAGRRVRVLGHLRIRLSTITWILLIIFMGIFYTKVVMILSTI